MRNELLLRPNTAHHVHTVFTIQPYDLPVAEDTFDETAGASVADILGTTDQQSKPATENDSTDAAARQQADASTR